jgi:hypothetical protein
MLFVLPGDSLIGFWMKDTLIALDMIWLNRDLEVFHIEGSVPPCHADPCPVYGPKTPAKYVLEIKSGETQRAHIEVGDKASIAAIPDAGAAGLPRHGVDPWRAKGSLILTAH